MKRGRDGLAVTLGAIMMVAWGAISLSANGVPIPEFCGSAPLTVSAPMLVQLGAALGLPAKFAVGWTLMIAAMMPPLVLQPLRHVRDRSFARQRGCAMASFSIGYAAVWMTAGAALQTLALLFRVAIPDMGARLACGLVIFILWQVSPVKQRCLNACHRRPSIAAFGLKAKCDAFAFGSAHGVWCVAACWALMLLPLLSSQGHVLVMAAASLFLIGERFERSAPPAWRLRGPSKALRILVAQARIRLKAIGQMQIDPLRLVHLNGPPTESGHQPAESCRPCRVQRTVA